MVRHGHLSAWTGWGAAVLTGCVGHFGDVDLPEMHDTALPGESARAIKVSSFTSQQTCASCHPRQADEWSESAHAHAMLDPVFQALIARAGAEAPEQRAFCTSCHTNIGSTTGAVAPDYSFATLPTVVMEGVTCESCHRVTSVFRSSNAGHTLDPAAPMQGSLQAGLTSPFHETERSSVLSSAELCGSCHDVRAGDVALEQPYAEWSSAPARDEGEVCVDCHMSATYGRAAEGFGLVERRVRRHTFRGPSALAWLGGRSEANAVEAAREVEEQLASALSLEVISPAASLAGAPFNLRVVIRNNISGHRFPTGSAFFREVWLEVQVRDARGLAIYQSGGPEARDASSLHDLWLSARLLDDSDTPTLLPWRAARVESHALEPLEERHIDLNVVVPSAAEGPLRVEAVLRFQSLPSALLDELGLPAELAHRIELQTSEASIALTPSS